MEIRIIHNMTGERKRILLAALAEAVHEIEVKQGDMYRSLPYRRIMQVTEDTPDNGRLELFGGQIECAAHALKHSALPHGRDRQMLYDRLTLSRSVYRDRYGSIDA